MKGNRYSYHGTKVPRGIPTAAFEGWEDRQYERRGAYAGGGANLYRYPWWKRALYRAGRLLGSLVLAPGPYLVLNADDETKRGGE